jgi:TAZ zinc finger
VTNNNHNETAHRSKEQSTGKQPDTKVGQRKGSILATPPQPSKLKAAVNKGNARAPPVDMVFTPPTRNKEKVAQEIVFTPPEQAKPKVRQDIIFTPTQQEKAKIKAPKTSTDLEDYTSVDSNHDHPQLQQPTSLVQPAITGQIWNPQAPENVFRMMLLQHAANCPCARGRCEYDPTCSEYRNVLAHILTCSDEECDVEKCRTTKQFLLTAQLMKEFNTNENAKEAKDFLVGVGAVAPMSVIQLPMGSGHSVLSDDQTWWSNDWGAVEDINDDSD